MKLKLFILFICSFTAYCVARRLEEDDYDDVEWDDEANAEDYIENLREQLIAQKQQDLYSEDIGKILSESEPEEDPLKEAEEEYANEEMEDPVACHWDCGTGLYHAAGTCNKHDGSCLCWWGWTGANARYINNGPNTDRIKADFCTRACHYTHDVRNNTCIGANPVPPSTLSISDMSEEAEEEYANQEMEDHVDNACDEKCGSGQYHAAGNCDIRDGRCLCWWGWTGENAYYINDGPNTDRIKADFCTRACHYTHDVRNNTCIGGNPVPPSTISDISEKEEEKEFINEESKDPAKCHAKCGSGLFHAAGKCQLSGKCLCWWGWTGDHASYITGGQLNNRILADFCTRPCHFTHDVRNQTCVGANPVPVPNPPPITGGGPVIPPTQGCHSKCGKYGGECDAKTKRCLCCWGWTGPLAAYGTGVHKDRIYADYCDKTCFYHKTHKNPACVPPKAPPKPPPVCDPRCEKLNDGKCVGHRCMCCFGFTGPKAAYGKGIYKDRIYADYCPAPCDYSPLRKNSKCIDPTFIANLLKKSHITRDADQSAMYKGIIETLLDYTE